MKSFGKKSRKSNRKPASKNIRLGFEPMELRQMMTVIPNTGIITTINPVAIMPPPEFAEGTITLNSGVLDIDLSQTQNSNVQIYINHRAGNGAGNLPDLLTVQLSNINSPQVWGVDPSVTLVTKIIVHSHAGNDFVDNRTGLPMVAYGGTGNDTFLGGAGDDILIAGSGNCFLDGRSGDDTLFGGSGSSALFGDDGYDSLYGGSGNNYLFGGNGNDHLYAGTGHSRLEGEAGTDAIIDPNHWGVDYSDYGLGTHVDVNGFAGFDFFDAYLKDANDRSLARVDYFEHNGLARGDMLGIYKEISTSGMDPNYPFAIESAIAFDGTVTANEFADLKTLTSGRLSIDQPTRYLAMKVVYGDRANANYQGGALGNLAAGASGDHLTKLVDKWFEGMDLPEAVDATLSTLRYEPASGNLFVNGPTYDDIDQAGHGGFGDKDLTGDCYFLAALGEIAQHSPQTIENMFIDNGDGTFTVKFYHNRAAAYVTVNRELPVFGYGTSGTAWAAGFGATTDPYGMTFSNNYDNPNNELWVALAEKAYAQLNESGWTGQDGTNSYPGIDGGYPADAFSQITGRAAWNTSVTTFWGDTQGAFANAFSQGKAMTLVSKNSSSINGFVVQNHVYMVVGYDTDTKQYRLFNPWGWDAGDAQPTYINETWAQIRHDFSYWTSVTV